MLRKTKGYILSLLFDENEEQKEISVNVMFDRYVNRKLNIVFDKFKEKIRYLSNFEVVIKNMNEDGQVAIYSQYEISDLKTEELGGIYYVSKMSQARLDSVEPMVYYNKDDILNMIKEDWLELISCDRIWNNIFHNEDFNLENINAHSLDVEYMIDNDVPLMFG